LVNDVVSEVGVMNFFVYWVNDKGKKELITCPLDGTILPGVTRNSMIQIAKTWKEFEVSETKFKI
jgi:branched-chain amino acid aminotransferase